MAETFTVDVICAWCKKDIKTGRQLTDEEYIAVNSTASHGICPECSAKHFPIPLPDEHKSFSLHNEMTYGDLSGGGISGKQIGKG